MFDSDRVAGCKLYYFPVGDNSAAYQSTIGSALQSGVILRKVDRACDQRESMDLQLPVRK